MATVFISWKISDTEGEGEGEGERRREGEWRGGRGRGGGGGGERYSNVDTFQKINIP